MNRYRVRISVTEHKPGFGIVGAVGGTTPDKLLDASFTTANVHEIRHIVDGLIAEGIPSTKNLTELESLMASGARGMITVPPTATESGDLNVSDTTIEAVRRAGGWLPPGGEHSGDCRCQRCAEPDAPDDTPPSMDTTAS